LNIKRRNYEIKDILWKFREFLYTEIYKMNFKDVSLLAFAFGNEGIQRLIKIPV